MKELHRSKSMKKERERNSHLNRTCLGKLVQLMFVCFPYRGHMCFLEYIIK